MMDYITQLTWRDSSGKVIHGPGSNFFIEPDGTHVEGEFQASKIRNPYVRRLAVKRWPITYSPGESKSRGRKVDLRKDWESVKVNVMAALVYQKFIDHESARMWLLSTGTAWIEEGNWWHDNFWGICNCENCVKGSLGENYLGKILMQVRSDINGA